MVAASVLRVVVVVHTLPDRTGPDRRGAGAVGFPVHLFVLTRRRGRPAEQCKRSRIGSFCLCERLELIDLGMRIEHEHDRQPPVNHTS